MKTTTERNYTDQKKIEWIKNLLEMSRDEKAQEAFQKMTADIRSKLYDYSYSNYFGLVIQTWMCGSYCFMFGSASKWATLKRYVRSEEKNKGMEILVPYTVEKKINGQPVIDKKTGKPAKITFFKLVRKVYGIDQTDAEDGSKFESFRTVVDFQEEMLSTMAEKVKAFYNVEFKKLDPSLGGFTDGKTITINSERKSDSQFCTLVHELSHCVLEHSKEEIRKGLTEHDIETEAELSTLIYCTLAGIGAKGSAHYLESHVDLNTVDMKRISRAIKSAGKIHEMIFPKKKSAVEEVA